MDKLKGYPESIEIDYKCLRVYFFWLGDYSI